jgi:hypothetical protein
MVMADRDARLGSTVPKSRHPPPAARRPTRVGSQLPQQANGVVNDENLRILVFVVIIIIFDFLLLLIIIIIISIIIDFISIIFELVLVCFTIGFNGFHGPVAVGDAAVVVVAAPFAAAFTPTTEPDERAGPRAADSAEPVIALVNLPTRNPTKPPTDSPTVSPTKAPTCNVTSRWVYNATTRAPIRVLRNNSVTCVAHPYNIEVRPCPDQASVADLPVSIRLIQQASKGRRRAVHRQQDWEAPFFLFGNAKGTGDVRPSPTPLHNGNYIVSTSVGGTIVFTQSCPCPTGKKGKNRCMRKQI